MFYVGCLNTIGFFQIKHPKEAYSEASVYICSSCPYKAVNLDTYIGHQRSHIEQMSADEASLEEVKVLLETWI